MGKITHKSTQCFRLNKYVLSIRVFLAELVKGSAGEEVNGTWWMQRDTDTKSRARLDVALRTSCCRMTVAAVLFRNEWEMLLFHHTIQFCVNAAFKNAFCSQPALLCCFDLQFNTVVLIKKNAGLKFGKVALKTSSETL